MNTDQFITDSAGQVYTVHRNPTTGLVFTKYSSAGAVLQTTVLNVGGKTPSMVYDELTNRIYVTYVVDGSGPISRILYLRKFDPSNILVPEWTIFEEYFTPIDVFYPKVIMPFKTGSPKTLQVVFIDQTNQAVVHRYIPDDGVRERVFETGFVTTDPEQFRVFSSSVKFYIALPVGANQVDFLRYDGLNYARDWIVTDDFGFPLQTKTGITMLEDSTDGSFFAAVSAGPNNINVIKVSSLGELLWSSPTALNITNLIGGIVHNLFQFEGVLLFSSVKTTGVINFTKVSMITGDLQTPSRETLLPGFVAGSVSQFPVVLSKFPWDVVYTSYINSSTNDVVLQRFQTPLVNAVTQPVSDLSEYQLVTNSDQTRNYVIFRHPTNGITLSASDNNNTKLYEFVMDPIGEIPSMVLVENSLVFVTVQSITSFSEYRILRYRRVDALAPIIVNWTLEKIISDTFLTGFKPKMVSLRNRLFCFYSRSGLVIGDIITFSNGTLSLSSQTGFATDRPEDIAVFSSTIGNNIILAVPKRNDNTKVSTGKITSSGLVPRFIMDIDFNDGNTKSNLFVREAVNSTTGFTVTCKTSANQFLVANIVEKTIFFSSTIMGVVNLAPGVTNGATVVQGQLLATIVGSTTVQIFSPVLGVINLGSVTDGSQTFTGAQLFNIPQRLNWNSNTGITNALNNNLIGVYNLQDYLVLLSLETVTFSFRATKVFTNGTVTQRTTSALPGTPTPNTGQLVVRTSALFDKYIFAGYTSNLAGPVTYPGASISMFSGSVATTVGTGSQTELSRYQHFDDIQGGLQYVTYRHPSLGIVIEKRNPDSSVLSPPVIQPIDVNGYNSSIHIVGSDLYVCYTTLSITLSEYVNFIVKKISKTSFAEFWSKTRVFGDSSVDTIYPRITDIGNRIHVLFIRNNNAGYSDVYNVLTGNQNTLNPYELDLEMTEVDKREFVISKTSTSNDSVFFIYTAFPRTDGSILTAKYASQTYIKQWEAAVNGGALGSNKRGIFIEEDNIQRSLVLVYTSGTSNYLYSKISSNGSVATDGVVTGLSNLFGNRISALFPLDEYMILFAIRTTGEVETSKIVVQTSTPIFPTDVVNAGFSPSDVNGRITLLSNEPWNRVVVSYFSIATGQPFLQTLFSPVSQTVTIDTTEVSQYQSTIDGDDNIYPIYYAGNTEGVAMTKFTIDGDPIIQRRFDFIGQTPSITWGGGQFLYVSYVKNIASFTSYLMVILKKVNRNTLSDVWTYNKLYTDIDPDTFRPRVLFANGRPFVVYKKNSNELCIQDNDDATGLLNKVIDTGIITTTDPTEISVVAGENNIMYFCFPTPSNALQLLRINLTTGSISWNVTNLDQDVAGPKKAVVVRYSPIYGIYVSYTTNTDTLRIVRCDALTGTRLWTIDADIPGVYGGRAHAFYLNNGLPLVFAIEGSTGDIKVKKFTEDGDAISTRTKHLETFDTDLFVNFPVIFSRENWDSIWLVFPDPTGPLYENWEILVNKLVSPAVPDPSETLVQLSEKQFAIDQLDNMYISYITELGPNRVSLSKIVPDTNLVPAHWQPTYNVAVITKDIDIGGQSPALYLNNGDLFTAYSKRLVTFTEFTSITIQSVDSTTLDTIWLTNREYTDSFIEFYKPKIERTSKGVHMSYFRQDGFLYIETYHPLTGQLLSPPYRTDISTTAANTGQLTSYSTDGFLYLALPLVGTGNISLTKFDMNTESVVWQRIFNGGTATPKTDIVMKASENDLYLESENIFLGFTDNNSTIRLAKISPDSTVVWQVDTGISTVDVYGSRIHGLYVFGGYPSVFVMRDLTTTVACTAVKYDEFGNQIDSKTVNAPTDLEPGFIDGYPIILSRSPWDVIFVEFYTNAILEYLEVSSAKRLAVVAIDAVLDFDVTVPISELSEYQATSSLVGGTPFNFITYTESNGTSGVRLLKKTIGGVIVSNILVDEFGQSPSVVVRPGVQVGSQFKDVVYVVYMRKQSGFIGSTIRSIKRYLADTMVEILPALEVSYPDSLTEAFRPRITNSEGDLYISYGRQTNNLFLERVDPVTGIPIKVLDTGKDISTVDPLTIRLASLTDYVAVVYPDGLQSRLINYDTSLDNLWEINLIEAVEFRLETGDDVTVGFRDSLGNIKVEKYNGLDGSLLWSYNFGINGFVGNSIHGLFELFGYPLLFNVTTSGEVEVSKLDEEGNFVSQRTLPLPGLNVSEIENYPVAVSRTPWNSLTLVYYTSVGNGEVNASPIRDIAIKNFSAPLENPLPIPVSEMSDQQCLVVGNHFYLVTSNQTQGMLVTKHLRSTGAIQNLYSPTTPFPYSPSIRHLNGRIYLSYIDFTIGYTEVVGMYMEVLDANNLTLIEKTTRGFPDPEPTNFRPRLAVSSSGIHRTYVRYNNESYLDTFNPDNFVDTVPRSTGDSFLGEDVLQLSLAAQNDKLLYARPVPGSLSQVVIRRYNPINFTNVIWSLPTEDFGKVSGNKSNILTRFNTSDDAYMCVTTINSSSDIIKLNTVDGTVVWREEVINSNLPRSNQGMDMFENFPMIYTTRATNDIVVTKFNELGVRVSTRTTSLSGLNYSGNVTGLSPVVLSNFPWDRMSVIHYTGNVSLNYQPNRTIAVRTFTSSPVNVLPLDPFDIRTSQGVYQEDGTAQAAFYTQGGGTRVYNFDGSIITGNRLISSAAYRPSISREGIETSLYLSYMRTFYTFTEYHNPGFRKLDVSNVFTDQWVDDILIYPDGSLNSFRPLTKVYEDRLFVSYVREDGFLIVESRNKDTGFIIERKITTHQVPDPTEMVMGGDYDLFIGYPNGGIDLKIVKFEITNNQFFEQWVTITSNSNDLIKRSLLLIQNISEHVMVSYIGYDPLEDVNLSRVMRLNTLNGSIVWSLPMFTDIPDGERLNGINYEGSFLNTSKVGLELFDTDSNTIDVVTSNISALATISRQFNDNVTPGSPLYKDNPLIMYNQGEGWMIIVYVDTSNVFRIIRTIINPGSTRVDFDSIGKAITTGYEYWWRPLIFINPSIRGTVIEERVPSSGAGSYKKWFPNGHLQFTRNYGSNNRITGYEQNFSSNGQWSKEINHTGVSTLREWSMPGRANLIRLFEQFDTNNDGFITETELEAGINSYGLTIPPEELTLLIQRMDTNEDGQVDYREFARVVSLSIYTKPIVTEKGFNEAVLVVDCQTLNGKRDGPCTEFANTLPYGSVIRTSSYTNDRLTGLQTSFYEDGSVKSLVTYSSTELNKRTGTYQEFYSNDFNNNLKLSIEYDPPGRENGNKSSFHPSGYLEYQSEIFTVPAKPVIQFRVTNYWSATQIKNQYFLDRRYQRVEEYIEYYEGGAVFITGTYERGLKSGLWTTFFEDPNVKRVEEFYVKNRLSGPGGRKTFNILGILLTTEDFPVYS